MAEVRRVDVDLLDLLAKLDEPALVAPLTFSTSTGLPVAEYERSRNAWIEEHGNFGSAFRCHLWRVDGHGVNSQPLASGHSYVPMEAWLGCANLRHERGGCQCVGGWIVRPVCEPCGWYGPIFEPGQDAVAAWHDHAWPGWRDLPVVERKPEGGGTGRQDAERAARWREHVEALYPQGWGRDGAPVITRRATGASRAVPGGSPWGGFDLAVQALDTHPHTVAGASL